MGHVNTAKENEIEHNRQAFEAVLPSIISTHKGKFALLHSREIVSYHDDALEAQNAGEAAFPEGEFSIQLVTQEAAGLGYLSYVLYSGPA